MKIHLTFLSAILAASSTQALASKVQPVSVATKPAGAQTASGESASAQFTANGRYVLFNSSANNLILDPEMGFTLDVFIRDLTTKTTRLVTVSADGFSGANQSSIALGASEDGSRVLILSDATNLVPNDTNRATDLFVRDLSTGRTFLVDGGPTGEFVSDPGPMEAVLTADGRRVFFESSSETLVSNDSNLQSDVFQKDLDTGVVTRLSVAQDGTEAQGGASHLGGISSSGHRLVFSSLANNLAAPVAANKTPTTVYVRNNNNGSLQRLAVDLPPSTFGFRLGEPQQLQGINITMSPDGRFVAFATLKRVTANSAKRVGHVFWFDLETGANVLASGDRNAGTDTDRPDDSGPVVSADGKTIAFEATFDQLPAEVSSIVVWHADGSVQTLENPFIDALIPPPAAEGPVLSADGKQLAFISSSLDAGHTPQLYRHPLDYVKPVEFQFNLVSASKAGQAVGGVDYSTYEFSPDGSKMVFDSDSPSLADLDFNNQHDVFLRDLASSQTELLSPALTDRENRMGNGVSSQPIVSANGRYVVFTSLAPDLAGTDENDSYDVFRRDLQTGVTELVSATPDGSHSGNFASSSLSVSADGRWIAFTSSATNLADTDKNRFNDVFVRDMQTASTRVMSLRADGLGTGNGASSLPVVSADGSVVVFESTATDLVPQTPGTTPARSNVFRYETATGKLSLVSSSTGTFPPQGTAHKPSVSGDGKTIAYVAGSRTTAVVVVTLDQPTPFVVQTNGGFPEFQTTSALVSLDGTSVVFDGSDTTFQRKQLVRYDVATGQRSVIPVPPLLRGSLGSILGSTTRDGWIAAFTSAAAFANADTNSLKDVYIADFHQLTVNWISAPADSVSASNGDSDSALISLDGTQVVFRSAASNLLAGDQNGFPDIFVHDVAEHRTRLVSMNTQGRSGNNRSMQPSINGDGTLIAFLSWAGDLVPNDSNQVGDIFVATQFDGTPDDIDGDGLPDAWEQTQFGTLSKTGSGDEDGDGVSNREEFVAGTNPTQAASAFRLQLASSDLGPLLQWQGVVGKRYTIEVSPGFQGPWTPLGTVQGTGKTETFVASHGAPAGTTAEFYRLRVE